MYSSIAVLVASEFRFAVSETLCGLNGVFIDRMCRCDAGWRGASCSELDLVPASPVAFGHQDTQQPTWGGTAIFEADRWHMIVGALAEPKTDNATEWKDDYPCNSKILRLVSSGLDPAGPYSVADIFANRSSWEPMLARAPNGSLVAMFFGNQSNPAPVGSPECVGGTASSLSHTTYITVSSGSVFGPWSPPQMVRGMENRVDGTVLVAGRGRVTKDPCSWRCANGNPGPAFHPNGTLFALMRSNSCLADCKKGEHISLWRADAGWDDEWTLVSDEPVLGWGNASETTCDQSEKTRDECTLLEDPYLWIDERGWHMLAHYQNNREVHKTRGAYAWSLDGLSWTLETLPRNGTSSAWEMDLAWPNGTRTALARRQRSSLVWDSKGRPTHVINGADFWNDMGTHWGTGMTLVQPLRAPVSSVSV